MLFFCILQNHIFNRKYIFEYIETVSIDKDFILASLALILLLAGRSPPLLASPGINIADKKIVMQITTNYFSVHYQKLKTFSKAHIV